MPTKRRAKKERPRRVILAARSSGRRTAAQRPHQKEPAPVKSGPKADGRQSAEQTPGFPIVAIGASAGGFEATRELLRNVPQDNNNMAFVVVHHLDPRHVSNLAKLLGSATHMRVLEVRKAIEPAPNTVYVLPPNKCLVYKSGRLALTPLRPNRPTLAIDRFFESVAQEAGQRVIGVLLSGTGSDGTSGLRAIKAAGGITFAQDEQSAKFPAMPRNAIESGFVDAVLSPKEIAAELHRIADHPYIQNSDDGSEQEQLAETHVDNLSRIFLTLKKHTGVDFSDYKHSTLQRRIHRRMALHRLDKMRQYANLLRNNVTEVGELFNDLLINVTKFFRDQGTFAALKKKFIPALLKEKSQKNQLRAWVPGCATGEEVYSLAICILEALGDRASSTRVHIFGTDLSEFSIERARLGIYSSAIEKDVSPQRLQRFFKKLDGTYQINRTVRDLCTFARQNITADPPFSRLDLISCSNVLIYLGPQLQKRVFPIFHYALNPHGYLMLGSAESVGVFSDLFEMVDRHHKIYAKKLLPGRPELEFNIPHNMFREVQSMGPARMSPSSEGRDFNSVVQHTADRIMLGNYVPAGVVIDENMIVRQFRGKTSLYLEHSAGPATLNLLHMVKASLLADLRAAIHRAMRTQQPVRKERALVKRDSKVEEVKIEVIPFKVPNSDITWALVVFRETGGAEDKKGNKEKKGRKDGHSEVQQLREELSLTKESLQAIIEEQEASNEELKSANEEIESTNEELQSTNEELETAKEQLQSTNEELTTLNEELTNRNFEIMQINSDLSNLLSSIQLPIVMVDNNLMVRRATPTSRDTFNITDQDVGRSITELRSNIDIPHMDKLIHDVIETLSVREFETRDKTGRLYSLRIRPYRTGDNKIDGAVLTLVDIGGTKQARKE